MKVVYSPEHARHDIATGTWVGVPIPADETPERVEVIRTTLEAQGHEVVAASSHDDTVLHRVHDPAMVEYMESAVEEWRRGGYPDDPGQAQVTGYAFPLDKVLHGLPLRTPRSPAARAGVWAMDTMTSIAEGTFAAARAAVDTAQTAAELVASGERVVYAATRPPGHHAGRGFFGGSCYLNNAGVAVETLILGGYPRVAVIDLDAHHGNGTQEIFYHRDDVFYASVHVDPGEGWFPHFVGFAEETGVGDGAGANLNLPLAPGGGNDPWLEAVRRAVTAASSFRPDAVVVSLGVDAGIGDPNSPLGVDEDGFTAAGAWIAGLGRPTVMIQEGGYVLATVGALVAATLAGFEAEAGGR